MAEMGAMGPVGKIDSSEAGEAGAAVPGGAALDVVGVVDAAGVDVDAEAEVAVAGVNGASVVGRCGSVPAHPVSTNNSAR